MDARASAEGCDRLVEYEEDEDDKSVCCQREGADMISQECESACSRHCVGCCWTDGRHVWCATAKSKKMDNENLRLRWLYDLENHSPFGSLESG